LATSFAPIPNASMKDAINATITIHRTSLEYGSIIFLKIFSKNANLNSTLLLSLDEMQLTKILFIYFSNRTKIVKKIFEQFLKKVLRQLLRIILSNCLFIDFSKAKFKAKA
jgi:hypothetical protein